jgi:hypothetical protein
VTWFLYTRYKCSVHVNIDNWFIDYELGILKRLLKLTPQDASIQNIDKLTYLISKTILHNILKVIVMLHQKM